MLIQKRSATGSVSTSSTSMLPPASSNSLATSSGKKPKAGKPGEPVPSGEGCCRALERSKKASSVRAMWAGGAGGVSTAGPPGPRPLAGDRLRLACGPRTMAP